MDANYTDDDYLAHYGVKGMKWGVRRDLRTLANNRRNKDVRKIKRDYELGKISNQEKKSKIQQANKNKTDYLNKVKNDFESGSKEKQKKISSDIKRQTLDEVPNKKIKNGARMVNHIWGALNISYDIINGTSTALIGGAVAGKAGAASGALATSMAVGIHAGRTWLIDKGLDKLS